MTHTVVYGTWIHGQRIKSGTRVPHNISCHCKHAFSGYWWALLIRAMDSSLSRRSTANRDRHVRRVINRATINQQRYSPAFFPGYPRLPLQRGPHGVRQLLRVDVRVALGGTNGMGGGGGIHRSETSTYALRKQNPGTTSLTGLLLYLPPLRLPPPSLLFLYPGSKYVGDLLPDHHHEIVGAELTETMTFCSMDRFALVCSRFVTAFSKL